MQGPFFSLVRDSCCLHRSEKLEAGPEIWKAYYAGFPMEDHFAANISCSGVSTHHQSGTWQPPFPCSPRLMQRADTVQLFVSDCSPATQGREGGGRETKPLRWSCGQGCAAAASCLLHQHGCWNDTLAALCGTTSHGKCCCLHRDMALSKEEEEEEEEPDWIFQTKCCQLLFSISCANGFKTPENFTNLN